MKRIFFPAMAATTLVALSSCSLFNKGVTASTPAEDDATHEHLVEVSTTAPAFADNVIDGWWTIIDVMGSSVEPAETQDETPTVAFFVKNDGEGDIYATAGCNHINGRLKIDVEGNLTISDCMSTMMACESQAMELESKITRAMALTKHYTLEHIDGCYFLYFKNAAGNIVLAARRWDIHFLNGAWAVTRVRDAEVPEGCEIGLVLDLPEERLHGNTGCNVINGRLSVATNRAMGIEFTNLATTRRACQEPAASLERQLLIELENVASCRDADGGNEALLLDSDGIPVISLRRLKLDDR